MANLKAISSSASLIWYQSLEDNRTPRTSCFHVQFPIFPVPTSIQSSCYKALWSYKSIAVDVLVCRMTIFGIYYHRTMDLVVTWSSLVNWQYGKMNVRTPPISVMFATIKQVITYMIVILIFGKMIFSSTVSCSKKSFFNLTSKNVARVLLYTWRSQFEPVPLVSKHVITLKLELKTTFSDNFVKNYIDGALN